MYINDGSGHFNRSADALPEIRSSGSRVHSYDYDMDGDEDLLICGRLVPGSYPMPANSYLLENISENGKAKFRDVTDSVAPDLRNLGMATDAVWPSLS